MDNENIPFIILNCAKNCQLGKHRIAAFLKGSKEKETFIHCSDQLYGGLFWLNIYTIEGYIEQLEQMGFLKREKVYGSIYSFYKVTNAGEKAIHEKAQIKLKEVPPKKIMMIASANERKTLELFTNGKSANEIAVERNLAVSTIFAHFEKLIANNQLNASQIIPEEKIKLITNAYHESSGERLREIKEKLPEAITYDEIRCVVAELKRASD